MTGSEHSLPVGDLGHYGAQIMRSIHTTIAKARADMRPIARIDLEPWEAEALGFPTHIAGIRTKVIGRVVEDG